MLAERRKSSVMRIFRQTIGLTVAALLVAAPVSAGAGTAQFRSAEDALQQGIGAYTGGYYEMAIPALEVAAAKNLFLARYYLARIYADNQSAHTDHAKAYFLYQQLANDYADVDPDDDRRAPFVAKALTALAGYVRRGLPELGLKPNAKRAGEYLHHAAIFFNDEDAQFELAKLQQHDIAVLFAVPDAGDRSDLARGDDSIRTCADLVIATGADGLHTVMGKGGDLTAFEKALGAMKPDRIVGIGGLFTRHAAMTAGESDADYIMFGEPGPNGQTQPFAETLDMASWWSEVFTVPCVAHATGLDKVEILAASGCDFISVRIDAGTAADTVRAILERASRALQVTI